MSRLAQGLASVLLLAGAALHAGCGNSASGGLSTAGLPAGAPGALSNADPATRPEREAPACVLRVGSG
jgi:hypothetical protein